MSGGDKMVLFLVDEVADGLMFALVMVGSGFVVWLER